jgi:chemotaxis protein CheC
MSNTTFTEEDRDYLEEMMNICAGNAATSLEQILKVKSEMHMPEIHIVSPPKVFSVIGDPLEPVFCAKMNMIGDIQGEMFFIVPQAIMAFLVETAQYSAHIEKKNGDSPDTSVIEEIGNILAGVYLTAIHDFSNLNIYHTIPIIAHDMIQAVLDEPLARRGVNARDIIIVVSNFTIAPTENSDVRTFLIFIPSAGSEKVLLDSIREARKIFGG